MPGQKTKSNQKMPATTGSVTSTSSTNPKNKGVIKPPSFPVNNTSQPARKSEHVHHVTPEKKRRKDIKFQKVRRHQSAKQKLSFTYVLEVESAGPHHVFTILTSYQKQTKTAGFLAPVNYSVKDAIFKPKDDDKEENYGAVLIDEDKFDCRFHTNLFLRVSHESNQKRDLGYPSNMFRTGLISYDDVSPVAHKEKNFRDICEKILLDYERAHQNKVKRTTVFEKWDASKHSITSVDGPPCPLHHIFIDESVGKILMAYLMYSGSRSNDSYEHIKPFFSR